METAVFKQKLKRVKLYYKAIRKNNLTTVEILISGIVWIEEDADK